MENDWSQDIESVLENIRINSVILSKEHKRRYFDLKENLKYYRLPVIVLSGINSIVSVGLQPYIEQGAISMITCLLALVCSIIGSIELYLAIYRLGKNTDPFQQRNIWINAIIIIESSNALAKKVEDKLCPLPIGILPQSNSNIELSNIV